MEHEILGNLTRLRLDQLSPDWDNPRFLPGTRDGFKTDHDVYLYIDRKYNAFAIADSIARHGYFETEPLIAIVDEERPEHYIVLEGNRRLTALQALHDPVLRKGMGARRWSRLPVSVELPASFPVYVASSRQEVAPILGFRHVTGNRPWDPYQQALYVADMIDGEELSADQIADLIGRKPTEVRAFYRNFSIVEQAEREFEIEDTKRVVDEFGIWTRALSSAGIRGYIDAPAPRDVVEGEYPLDDDADERLARLFVWLFGVPRSAEDQAEGTKSREGRAIGESRHLNRLGAVLAKEESRELLEAGASLEEAELAAVDSRKVFFDALSAAEAALMLAAEHKPARTPRRATEHISKLRARLDDLI